MKHFRCITALSFCVLLISAGCDRDRQVLPDLRVVTLNIWNDKGDWEARRHIIIEELGKINPEIILLQEVLQHDSLPNQAAQLADSLGYAYYFSSVDSLGRSKRYGNAILTSLPMLRADWKPLEPLTDYRNIGYVRVDWHGTPIDVFVAHLHHKPDSIGQAIRMEQMTNALHYIEANSAGDARIFGGDFNAISSDPSVGLAMTVFEDTHGESTARRKDNPAVESGGPDGPDGRPSTLNTAFGHTPRWIDYVLVSRDGALVPTDVTRIMTKPADSTWASDHFGVLATLSIKR